MFQLANYQNFAADCIRDTPPPCGSACYFDFDIRKFISHLQKQRYEAALRLYRKAVLYPGLVSQLCDNPCQKACVLKQWEEAIPLGALERACYKQTKKTVNKYSLPPQNKKVAVIGAGLSGLAATISLARLGYAVTLYEKESRVGGRALDFLDAATIKASVDLEVSAYEKVTCQLKTQVTSLTEIVADLVLITTGHPDDSLAEKTDLPYAQDRKAVFFAGHRRNPNLKLMEAMADAINVSQGISLWLRVPDFGKAFSEKPEKLIDQHYYALSYDRDFQYRDQILAESDSATTGTFYHANRCLRCNCSACYNICPMLQKARRYPIQMGVEMLATVKPLKIKRPGVRSLTGCTFCGRCAEVCPVGINVAPLMRQARRDFFAEGTFPKSFHEFWLRDLNFSQSDQAFLEYKARPGQPVSHLFFPGCQLSASDPRYVTKVFAFLMSEEQNPALLLSCCGLPADWAGDVDIANEIKKRILAAWQDMGKPPVICACRNCQDFLQQKIPEMMIQSLYIYLDEHADNLSLRVEEGKQVRISDPCVANKDQALQTAISSLVKKAGLVEDVVHRNHECCGTGGHIYPANPDVFAQFRNNKIAESPDELIVYCSNCRDVIAQTGQACRHILDVLFQINDSCYRPAPSFSMRRLHRQQVRAFYTGEKVVMPKIPDNIIISDAIQEKIDHELILNEEVYQTLIKAEQSRMQFYDPDTDLYYAHLRISEITIWIVFRMQGEKKEVIDVYQHRVMVRSSRGKQ